MSEFSSTRTVVTGAAGFIGSHLVGRLLAAGAQVTAIDNLDSGRKENLPLENPNLLFVEESILTADLPALFKDAMFVFHHAAIPSVPQTIAHPLETHRVNVEGSLKVLLAARDAGVRRVVYASSSAVYGNEPTLPKREDMAIAPASPYAVHKAELELYGKMFSSLYSLETVGLRYFNVFGPRQSPQSPYAAVIPIFLDRMLRGDAPVIFGDGSATRDFVHVDDVVEANLLAATVQGAAGVVCNIAAGQSTSLLELVAHINNALGTNFSPVHENARDGDILHSTADIDYTERTLGYLPSVTLQEGLEKMLAQYKK